MTPGAEAVFNEDGGMVDADASVAASSTGATAAGAEIRTRVTRVALDLDGDRPRVRTDDGDITARHVVVAAGAWTSDLLPDLPDLDLPIRVTRQAWFTMRPDNPAPVGPGRMPVWCDYDTMYYGFPDHGPGLKIADDTPGREVASRRVEPRRRPGRAGDPDGVSSRATPND